MSRQAGYNGITTMPALREGDHLGRYEILGPLGAGGMGEVYRAHDERLDRDVAIKVLPEEVARDPERLERFEREAKATAALAHPNIIEIHDFGTDREITYAVTELLEGETLRTAMESRNFTEGEAVEVGAAIADGLAAAHGKGIVHRDLKPENIFVTSDGRVKILDFGLAKVQPALCVDEDGEESTEFLLSQPGMVMGTLGYMAPEQLRGEPADHRSDLFALGCVLYEMLSGRRPFGGKTAPEVASAILQSDPELLAYVDPELASIVRRCLEKRQDDRFERAIDVASALGRVGDGSPEPPRRFRLGHVLAICAAVVVAILFLLPPEGIWQRITGNEQESVIRSIAVLPFDNLSEDPEQEFFADGMTDELIMNLAKVEALEVISRTSAMVYKGSDKPLPEIAHELGVDAIIEGTVLRAGDAVRITVQLIHGATDRHLWADSYQRPLRDVLMLQSEVARAVAHEVDIALTPEEDRRLARTTEVDPIAYEAYMKGMHHFMRFTGPDTRRAVEYFEAAIAADPGFVNAYTMLAAVHLNATYFLSLPPANTVPAARELTRTALELDPSNPGALVNMAWIAMTYDWDWETSERFHLRALESNPGLQFTHHNFAFMLASVGRFDEAISHARRAVTLDPASPLTNQSFGWLLYHARRYDEAIEQLEHTIELYPGFWFAYHRLAHVYLAIQEYEKGIEAARQSINLAGPGTIRSGQSVLAQLLAAAGRREEALAVLAKLEAVEAQHYLPPTDIARVHAALGHTDDAFRWLDKAVKVHDADLFMTLGLARLGPDPQRPPVRRSAPSPEFPCRLRPPWRPSLPSASGT